MIGLKEQPHTHTIAAHASDHVHSGERSSILDNLLGDSPGDAVTFCDFLQNGREISVSWGDLRDESRRYAAFFQQHGVSQGDVVLIILKHSPELFHAFLGAMRLGAIPSFMPPPTAKQDARLYWNSHRKLFERIETGTLLTYPENKALAHEQINGLSWRLLDAGDAIAAKSENFSDPSISPGQIAFLQHSSGTTGLKKGVALSHRAVLNQVTSYATALKLSPNDRVVSWLPLYHDMGLIACFLLPLITRTPVVMIDPFEWVVNPSLLFTAIHRYRATLCWQPNFAFHHLCRTVRASTAPDLSSMRAWLDCSEPCRAETFQLFAKHFAKGGVRAESLHVCYAMAETVFAISQTSLDRTNPVLTVESAAIREGKIIRTSPEFPHQSLLSAGAPITGLTVRIIDHEGGKLPEDTVGEISVSGDCLFDGYFKLESETEKKLCAGWYQTGDLGFLHNGELFVTGRKNDLIIVHGRNYYAHELEYLVNQVDGVHPGRNVAAGWLRSDVGSEEIIIIAETNLSVGASRAELTASIKQTLLDQSGLLVFDVHLVSAGWLVKTTSGKLSRIDNLNKYLAARDAV